MTATYLVLGDPVEHSLSPTIQNAAFAHHGLDATYGRRRVDASGFAQLIDEMRAGDVSGVNITMPHKALAARSADRIDETARAMGAVNTLWREGAEIVGTSTDPAGVLYAWSKAGLPETGTVLILGAGGAAAAALVALRGRSLRIAARREEAARALVVGLASDASVVEWGTAVPGAVIVNATPIGMHGESIPDQALRHAGGLLEMTYGAGRSPAAIELSSRGLAVADGELMLVGQGAESFSIWTGLEPPHDVMLRSIQTAESGR